jgi:hypothetical protein
VAGWLKIDTCNGTTLNCSAAGSVYPVARITLIVSVPSESPMMSKYTYVCPFGIVTESGPETMPRRV